MIKRIDQKANARTRVLTDDEIRAVRTKLDADPGEAADAVWLRLVLGQRAEETAGDAVVRARPRGADVVP